ncbi:hypothetical protein GCM10010869_04640 [Mesorhizobium tianshanense]|uniref:Putative RNA-binding Zn ribbon-like protein n=1 Tax=Mesorhizobium tianshanense TaxID=39844 RepID=A0A562NBK9_9HYPH|nr:CGNR zinc finger domain-containing protein [Mesorhizobium tianshanense]TWI29490.1 putative RNA-binding Zn ribbon-like protein [Mesorhizobium tianshanense]GLS34876.1 hypothetical protein GCM10010869_04640 [Mesorhizobium tianshanense]
MTYSNTHPLRLIGGRLALDFLNTANWASDGSVVHEKIESLADLDIWLQAAGLPDAARPGSIDMIHDFRTRLRGIFRGEIGSTASDLQACLREIQIGPDSPITNLARQPVLSLITVSALSILSDPKELARVKTCPGAGCGWMFLDETKDARRKWCIMETCGNRAKASRNYAKKSAGKGS